MFESNLVQNISRKIIKGFGVNCTQVNYTQVNSSQAKIVRRENYTQTYYIWKLFAKKEKKLGNFNIKYIVTKGENYMRTWKLYADYLREYLDFFLSLNPLNNLR